MPTEPSPAERVREEIRRAGPIPFARFMEIALYDPAGGYYGGGGARIGTAGDFYTASDVGRAFGAAIARQVQEIDRAIGPLDPFHVVEFGAGRGLLARDVLDTMVEVDRDLSGRLSYVMVDRSEAMRSEATRRVPEARCLAPEELEGGRAGCVLAVELFDALPVHRVRRCDGALVEIYVDVDDADRLVEVERPCSDVARALAERFGAAAEEGLEAEVAPGAAVQLDVLAGSIDRGVLLIVDYGERAERLYGPANPAGTLLAYRQHTTGQRYLEHVGEQDLTAHVNFSALEQRAGQLGLETLAYTTQDRFLVANGILEVFGTGDGPVHPNSRSVKRRLQAMQLIHPHAMGRRFKVLALAKGCAPDLGGLRDPFAGPGPLR